jgi:N-carbamoyl-L-amino-acid hydrolase
MTQSRAPDTAFAALWREFEPLGRDPRTGGYRRYSWTPADAACRAWFTDQAEKRGLAVEPDNNGNLWAWWGQARAGAIATGSHLDSVPDGGGFDGGLGVVAALAAVDLLQAKDFNPERAVVLAVFTEEEGADGAQGRHRTAGGQEPHRRCRRHASRGDDRRGLRRRPDRPSR